MLKILQNQTLTRTSIPQAIARALYPFKATRKIHRGPLKGFRFRVSRGMGFTYAWGIIGVEQWEFGGLVRPGMCVYDIGANCGQSTLNLAHAVGASGRVYAFEPVPSIFDELAFNTGLNPSLKVTPICAAASEHNGYLDFQFDKHLVTQGHLLGVEPTYVLQNAKIVSVRAIRLDDYKSEHWGIPHFIKLDVEGGAGAALRGAQKLIAEHRPLIFVELHGPEEQQAVRNLLIKFQYKARTISGANVSDPTSGWFNPLICQP
jgi:FkbM family methyltransferase